MANDYVYLNTSNVVLYDPLLCNKQPYEPIYMSGFTMFSGKTLFIFYIFTLMRLLQKERWQKLLRPFQFVGRMALTNYISHTIITLVVFGLVFKNSLPVPLWIGPLFCIGFIQYKSLLVAGGSLIISTVHLNIFGA